VFPEDFVSFKCFAELLISPRFFHDFLDPDWIRVDTGWMRKEKVHKKNRESPRNFGYKMYPEATPTRSRTYTMDTEKILLFFK